ncbi:MAG: response regulator transcription factor [Clostridiales Family XIII bacterium]|nr:response regulator transcription factor [Clostridiales Family XIII bacterium]
MQNIYFVEDDDNIRELVIYALTASGYRAQGFVSGKEFFEALEEELPHLVLLDIMLPGEDGLSLLSKLKVAERFKEIPVIMLTAKGSEYDRIKGLDLGADDYITKPFSVMEAISRVRAVLRRSAHTIETEDTLRIGALVLSEQKRSVTADGVPVTLTFKEFELLHHFMLNENKVLSREKLLDRIWGFDYLGETRTVDMHVKTLRQKLGTCSSYIITVRGVGYKLEAQD